MEKNKIMYMGSVAVVAVLVLASVASAQNWWQSGGAGAVGQTTGGQFIGNLLQQLFSLGFTVNDQGIIEGDCSVLAQYGVTQCADDCVTLETGQKFCYPGKLNRPRRYNTLCVGGMDPDMRSCVASAYGLEANALAGCVRTLRDISPCQGAYSPEACQACINIIEDAKGSLSYRTVGALAGGLPALQQGGVVSAAAYGSNTFGNTPSTNLPGLNQRSTTPWNQPRSQPVGPNPVSNPSLPPTMPPSSDLPPGTQYGPNAQQLWDMYQRGQVGVVQQEPASRQPRGDGSTIGGVAVPGQGPVDMNDPAVQQQALAWWQQALASGRYATR
ncbi:hypothetical protein D6783_04860 [Candidatus Woesearchaeota archaeon]|nr:MAG: hypothetical protein D6783_04860 [Candidatus Woesearchaeota archaeon]